MGGTAERHALPKLTLAMRVMVRHPRPEATNDFGGLHGAA
jgi:hypothetical protein